MATILVVEDNDRLRRLMMVTLSREGHTPLEACNGQEALDVMERQAIALIIADVMMPEMDGFALVQALRDAKNTVPVLMVTAKEALEDKRMGFSVGVDDYMVKPIDMEEMLMRVKALLRRAMIAESHLLRVGQTSLNEESLTVLRGDRVVVLPQKEFFLLQMLLSYPERIFTRQTLMDQVWGYETDSDPRTVDVHIRRLREKFIDNPDFEIDTVRGMGYRAVLK